MKTQIMVWSVFAILAWAVLVHALVSEHWVMAAVAGPLLSIDLFALGWSVGRELLWRRYVRDLGEAGWVPFQEP